MVKAWGRSVAGRGLAGYVHWLGESVARIGDRCRAW